MKKGVAYCRVSTQKQGRSTLGLLSQRAAVEAYAKANQIELVNEFIEIESGKNNDRVKLQKAFRCCEWNDAVLLIAKIDRLTRNLHFITLLEKSKVQFLAVDNPNASSLVLHILVSVAQYERETDCQRTSDVLQYRKSQGVELGTYGKYVLSVRNKRRAMIRALRLKPLVIDLMAHGITSIRKLVAAFNEMGIPTPTGAPWHKTTMVHLLARLNIKTPRSKTSHKTQPAT